MLYLQKEPGSREVKSRTVQATMRENNTSLLVKTSDEPIGSGVFEQVFLTEY